MHIPHITLAEQVVTKSSESQLKRGTLTLEVKPVEETKMF